MSRDIKDRTLALAGMFQAIRLVQQVARRGYADEPLLEVCIKSLFVTNPQRTEDVFGGTENLRQGLQILLAQLDGRGKREAEITRYFVTLLHLERKLSRRRDLLERIAQGLERSRFQTEHFAITHPNVVAGLADIYSNTISTLSPRVMVSGEHGYLSNPDNAGRVRALLLAAIRSAVLWSQCGGTRLQLLFGRKPLVQEAERLLQWLGTEPINI